MPPALGLSHLGSGLPAVNKSTDAWRARRILVSVERQCSFVGRGKMGKQTALGFSAESKLQEALNAAVVVSLPHKQDDDLDEILEFSLIKDLAWDFISKQGTEYVIMPWGFDLLNSVPCFGCQVVAVFRAIRVVSMPLHGTPKGLLHSIETGHNANIFSTKFVPDTSDDLVVSGAGDAEVRIFSLSHSSSRSAEAPLEPVASYKCHTMRVKKLAVMLELLGSQEWPIAVKLKDEGVHRDSMKPDCILTEDDVTDGEWIGDLFQASSSKW
ncbi:hypothetical protein ZIOFF_068717 [Zingiber officinale]|uniref:Uncharacterized protein n=1 Tax=Zingiber officinale TaxID=94328 RepID=A0A8J5BM92_ZINOF|nr:hypothetical protein ZIOFF_068717 [Zingiber officinale]